MTDQYKIHMKICSVVIFYTLFSLTRMPCVTACWYHNRRENGDWQEYVDHIWDLKEEEKCQAWKSTVE